jgi:uncharacterized membrane protein
MGWLELIATALMNVLILVVMIYAGLYVLVPFAMLCVVVARYDLSSKKRQEEKEREKNAANGYVMTNEELDRMYGGPW